MQCGCLLSRRTAVQQDAEVRFLYVSSSCCHFMYVWAFVLTGSHSEIILDLLELLEQKRKFWWQAIYLRSTADRV